MTAEWLTRVSIWLAMSAWVCGIVFRGNLSRLCWTVGGIGYFLHILFAYAGYYEWSHRIAWEKTAEDTAAVTGYRTGFGLLLNFLLAAWLGWDLWNQWRGNARKGRRTTEALVLFFIVNGAIVFGEGPVVVLGILLSALVIGSWLVASGKRGAGLR